jgi:hypothetical protein
LKARAPKIKKTTAKEKITTRSTQSGKRRDTPVREALIPSIP